MQTKEEVMLALGVNNDALAPGLQSASSKIDLWAKQAGAKFSAAFRNSNPLEKPGHGLTGLNDPEQKRLADVEEASRRNQARRLLRIREEDRAKQIAHMQEMARKAKEDLAAENSFKNRMKFMRAAAKLGGAMAILSAPAIADSVIDSVGNSFKRLGEIFTDWREMARLGTGGGGLGSGADAQAKEIARIKKLHELNQKRWAAEKKSAEEINKLNAEFATAHEARLAKLRDLQFNSADGAGKLKMLEAERKAIADNIAANEEELRLAGFLSVQFESAEKREQFKKGLATSIEVLKGKILEKEIAITEELKKQFDLSRTPANALKRLQDYQRGEAQYNTVDELAMNGWSQFQDEAQRIKQLERFAKYNRSGYRDSDVSLAEKQEAEIVNLKQFLGDRGAIAKNPVVEELKSMGVMFEKGISVKELQGED